MASEYYVVQVLCDLSVVRHVFAWDKWKLTNNKREFNKCRKETEASFSNGKVKRVYNFPANSQ